MEEVLTPDQLHEADLWFREQHDLHGSAWIVATLYNCHRSDNSVWFTPEQLLGLEDDAETEAAKAAAAEAMFRADQEARRKLANTPIIQRPKRNP